MALVSESWCWLQGRLKREVFIARPLNHIVVEHEPLISIAAFCDPFIAARVVTMQQMEWGGHAIDGATTSLRVSTVRISLQPIITASYARCLHALPLSAHNHPLRSQPINRRQPSRSLPRVLSLSLSVSFLKLFLPAS